MQNRANREFFKRQEELTQMAGCSAECPLSPRKWAPAPWAAGYERRACPIVLEHAPWGIDPEVMLGPPFHSILLD